MANIKPSFLDKYADGLDSPVATVAYLLTHEGRDVVGTSEADPKFVHDVHAELQNYRDTDAITYQEVEWQLKLWLAVNDRRWAE